MAAFKRKLLLTLAFLKYLGQEFRLTAVFGAFLWFHVQVIMHASMMKEDCARHWATSAGSRTRWGRGANAWWERLAICLGHCRGTVVLGFSPLVSQKFHMWSWAVMTSEQRFVTRRLEAKHCPTSSFGDFMFCSLRVFIQMMMKTPLDICRSCLGRQLQFSANILS